MAAMDQPSPTRAAHNGIAYRVRISPRAKRLQLRVTPLGEVEVVVPPRFDVRLVPRFVAEHHGWLERKLAQFEQRRRHAPELHASVPEALTLQAIDEQWQVEYYPATDIVSARLRAEERRRALHVETGSAEASRAALQQWLSRKGKRHLVPWLAEVSREVDLPFARATVRGQKTRWGSCSARGNININRNLLFLPPPLVRYLFVHELCHTVHMNHSPAYWALVAQLEPGYRELDAGLRGAAQWVPVWAY